MLGLAVPVPAAGRGLFLPVLCPCSGFVEGGQVPLGVSPPHPTGYSDLSPAPCPAKSMPWLENGLMGEVSLCAFFSHCYSLIQGHPHPGTSSPGYILVRAEGSTAKQPRIGSGLAQGQRVGSGPLLSTPRAPLVLGPHTWFIRGRSRRSSHVLSEAVPCSWQPVSGWWDQGQVGQRVPDPTGMTLPSPSGSWGQP